MLLTRRRGWYVRVRALAAAAARRSATPPA